VAVGVWRLKVALPGHSIGHVNAYALLYDDGVLLVDAGWSSAASRLTELLGSLGMSLRDVREVVFTHLHADHCGLAAELQRAGAAVAMHAADAELLESRYFNPDRFQSDTTAWLVTSGAPKEAIEASCIHVLRLADQVEPFVPDRLLADGDVVTRGAWSLSVLQTPGHTPGSVCLHDRNSGLLFTGDHVFPRIRASPTYRPQSTPDPVGDYFASLDRLEALDVGTVLPGHQGPFRELGQRLAVLRQYHRTRMQDILQVLRHGPATAWQVASSLNRTGTWNDRSWESRFTALGETLAHLARLERERQVHVRKGPPSLWSAGSG
jgi:glyoxylase-like metal-dependent hydrolase (beta-lactamase superfamily II)